MQSDGPGAAELPTAPVSVDPAEWVTARQPVVDGLRTVAVVLVVLHHAEVPGFRGGFVGVDIFFAISGYLITPRLLAGFRDEPKPLVAFWAGRVRRILPAVAFVVVVTCLAAAVVLSAPELGRISIYGAASSLFSLNNLAAWRGGDYFAGSLRDSPFLNLWSLGVEEQFYLVWPLMIGAVVGFRRTSRRAPGTIVTAIERRRLVVLMASAGVVSVVASLWLTNHAPLWAFYGLLPRMFEFAAGGLAAIVFTRPISRARSQALLVVGVAAIAGAVVLTPSVGFPGGWPLLSVFGTVAVMVAGRWAPDSSLARPLSTGPVPFLGRYSYSWYLWHWPVLVLTLAATNGDATPARIASVASLALAVPTYHLVEEPIRRAEVLIRSPARSALVGLGTVVVALVACTATFAWGRVGLRDPQVAEWHRAAESYGTAGCTPSDRFDVPTCLGGSARPGAPLLVLAGDSHAGQWMAAFSRAGRRHGFAVALRTSGNCPAAPTTDGAELGDDCRAFARGTADLIESGAVDAVVISDAMPSRDHAGGPAAWSADVLRLAEGNRSVPVGIIVEQPLSRDPLRCLSRGFSERECSVPPDEALASNRRYAAAESDLERAGVRLLDLTSVYCGPHRCPLRVDGAWISARNQHLTRDFTYTRVPELSRFAERLLGADASRDTAAGPDS